MNIFIYKKGNNKTKLLQSSGCDIERERKNERKDVIDII